MKNNVIKKIAFALLALLFINMNVQAELMLQNFPRFKQTRLNTCWAAVVRMVTAYYNVERSEDEIVRLALNLPDTETELDISNTVRSTSDVLSRLLININVRGYETTIPQQIVADAITLGMPVIANRNPFDENGRPIGGPGHAYVIIGYEWQGDDLQLIYVDPNDEPQNGPRKESYNAFERGMDFARGEEMRWTTSLLLVAPPPAMPQTIVGRISSPIKTVMDGVNAAAPNDMIHIWDSLTYNESVVIVDKPVAGIVSATWLPKPTISGTNALRVLGYSQNILVNCVNFNGDSVIYNAGTMTFLNSSITSASGYALNNTGTIYFDYAENRIPITVSATSGNAIRNTGEFFMFSSTINAAQGHAVIHNEGNAMLTILGATTLGTSDTAISNQHIGGLLVLGGSPNFTGLISGFHPARIGLHTASPNTFTPGNRVYTLAPARLRNGDVVVINGARHVDNFRLTDTNFTLSPIMGNLVAISNGGLIFVNKIGAGLRNLWDALFSAGPGQDIVITDNEWYEEQVTIFDSLPYLRLRHQVLHPSSPRPRIVYPGIKPNRLSQQSAADVAAISAVRVLGAEGILIDSVDIEGENAVYNTGDVAVRNATVSATSYYAFYNTGFAEINNVTLSSESNHAIYNTGSLYIIDGELSAASDTAIYNVGEDGELTLSGSPIINGAIIGFGAGKMSVMTISPNDFFPGNRKYQLAPNNIRNGDVVVIGGARFINNFEILDTSFALVAKGNDLVALSLLENVSVTSHERDVPDVADVFDVTVNDETAVVIPVDKQSATITAGPNPVDRQSGGVNFYITGMAIAKGTFVIYDANGNVVNRIVVDNRDNNFISSHGDDNVNNNANNNIATWDLRDVNNRLVNDGTYLIVGNIETFDGGRWRVSALFGVRQ